MGELAVRAVDLAPLVVEPDDLGHLLGQQPMHGLSAGSSVGELAVGPALAPAVGPDLTQLQLPARPPEAPALVGGLGDEVEQSFLGDRVDTSGDPATQPQRPFPSTSMSLTAISLRASPRRSASARAASSSRSRSLPWLPGRD